MVLGNLVFYESDGFFRLMGLVGFAEWMKRIFKEENPGTYPNYLFISSLFLSLLISLSAVANEGEYLMY